MIIYKYTEDNKKEGEINMLNDEICNLRDKLNKSIERGDDYSIIYQLSIELDELIAQYYGCLGTGTNPPSMNSHLIY